MPRSLPKMVMVVPPSGGPDIGKKLSMTGSGHCEDVVETAEGHFSVNVHSSKELHQPHSKPVPMLAAKQVEQLSSNLLQSYSVTT